MFERFTDSSRRVVTLSQEAAKRLGQPYIGTEHLLIAMTEVEDTIAYAALQSLGLTTEQVEEQVVEIVGRGDNNMIGHIPFTPRAQKIIDMAGQDALRGPDKYVGPQHMLDGILKEGKGVAAQALTKLAGDLDRVREHLAAALKGSDYLVETPVPDLTPQFAPFKVIVERDEHGAYLAIDAIDGTIDIVGMSVSYLTPEGIMKTEEYTFLRLDHPKKPKKSGKSKKKARADKKD